jgi:hypothetical protein
MVEFSPGWGTTACAAKDAHNLSETCNFTVQKQLHGYSSRSKFTVKFSPGWGTTACASQAEDAGAAGSEKS